MADIIYNYPLIGATPTRQFIAAVSGTNNRTLNAIYSCEIVQDPRYPANVVIVPVTGTNVRIDEHGHVGDASGVILDICDQTFKSSPNFGSERRTSACASDNYFCFGSAPPAPAPASEIKIPEAGPSRPSDDYRACVVNSVADLERLESDQFRIHPDTRAAIRRHPSHRRFIVARLHRDTKYYVLSYLYDRDDMGTIHVPTYRSVPSPVVGVVGVAGATTAAVSGQGFLANWDHSVYVFSSLCRQGPVVITIDGAAVPDTTNNNNNSIGNGVLSASGPASVGLLLLKNRTRLGTHLGTRLDDGDGFRLSCLRMRGPYRNGGVCVIDSDVTPVWESVQCDRCLRVGTVGPLFHCLSCVLVNPVSGEPTGTDVCSTCHDIKSGCPKSDAHWMIALRSPEIAKHKVYQNIRDAAKAGAKAAGLIVPEAVAAAEVANLAAKFVAPTSWSLGPLPSHPAVRHAPPAPAPAPDPAAIPALAPAPILQAVDHSLTVSSGAARLVFPAMASPSDERKHPNAANTLASELVFSFVSSPLGSSDGGATLRNDTSIDLVKGVQPGGRLFLFGA